MRERISDAATRLFAERGFDNVTVDDIAATAAVGRKTVFNHFSRKEDLFFDRDDDVRRLLGEAISHDGPAPAEALRLLAHRLVAERSPYVESADATARFIETIVASKALTDRARAIRDELVEFTARSLATRAGRDLTDPDAFFASSLILTVWIAARVLAHRAYREHLDADAARAVFLGAVDRGHDGVRAALSGTPYV